MLLVSELIKPPFNILPEAVLKLTLFSACITGCVPPARAAWFEIDPPAARERSPELIMLPELTIFCRASSDKLICDDVPASKPWVPADDINPPPRLNILRAVILVELTRGLLETTSKFPPLTRLPVKVTPVDEVKLSIAVTPFGITRVVIG